jgi:hypothetical protein
MLFALETTLISSISHLLADLQQHVWSFYMEVVIEVLFATLLLLPVIEGGIIARSSGLIKHRVTIYDELLNKSRPPGCSLLQTLGVSKS